MKKLGKLLIDLIEAVVVLYVIVLTACLLFVNSYGYTEFGNYTIVQAHKAEASTLPNVKNGDLLIIKNGNDIVKGNVIYYYAGINDKYYIKSGKVTEITGDEYGTFYKLDKKNETNTISDQKLVGNYISIHHNVGKILDVLESKIGFLLLVLLPIMCIFIYHVYNFVIILKYEEREKEEN